MLLTLINLYFQTDVSPYVQACFFATKILIKKFFFWRGLGWNKVKFFRHLDSQKNQKTFNMDTTRFSNSRVSKTADLISLLMVSSKNFLLVVGKPNKESVNSIRAVESWWTKMPGSEIWVDLPFYLNSFFSSFTQFSFASICQSIAFFTWGWVFLSSNHEVCLLFQNWNSDWPKIAKMLLVLRYFDFLTRPCRKPQISIFLWRSQLTMKFCQITLG